MGTSISNRVYMVPLHHILGTGCQRRRVRCQVPTIMDYLCTQIRLWGPVQQLGQYIKEKKKTFGKLRMGK